MSDDKWESLLLKVIRSLMANSDVMANSTKFTILLLPFLLSSSKNVQNLILEFNLPFVKDVKSKRLFF